MIRYAEEKDYEEVEALMQQLQRLHIEWRPDIYKEAAKVLAEEDFKELVAERQILIAEKDGATAGFLSFAPKYIQGEKLVSRKVLFVDAIAVDEKYRGQGIGHELFAYLKILVKEQGFDGMELQVNARNEAARRMYEEYGFVEKSINMELKREAF